MSICDIYNINFCSRFNSRAKVALTLSRERKAIMPTAVAPKSKPTILERAQMRALKNSVGHAMRGQPRRAALWAGIFAGLGGLRSN